MALNQPIRPGLSAPLVNSVPEEWSGVWFRRFITNFLTSLVGKQAGVSGPAASGVAVPLTILQQNPFAVYVVSAALAGVNDAVNYSAVSIVCVNGSVAKINSVVTASLLTISLSGMTVQATQSSGSPQVSGLQYSLARIA